jgi:hypothetical protein
MKPAPVPSPLALAVFVLLLIPLILLALFGVAVLLVLLSLRLLVARLTGASRRRVPSAPPAGGVIDVEVTRSRTTP